MDLKDQNLRVDFCTTSTARPSILDRTYKSFRKNLRGVLMDQCKLYINIDSPISSMADVDGTIKVAESYFREVIPIKTTKPSFPQAVKNCMKSPTTICMFYLEDDWELLYEVNLMDLHKILMSNDVSCVNLRAYNHFQNTFACLSPGLWKSKDAVELSGLLNIDHNPEKQIRPKSEANPGGGITKFKSIHYPNKIVLRDIGRQWLRENNIAKHGGEKFTNWRVNTK